MSTEPDTTIDTPPESPHLPNARRPYRRAPEAKRRNDLIRATLDCVAELGLRGTSIRAIAVRAGVTSGLIRHYFASKDQIIYAAYRETISGMTEAAKAAVAASSADPELRLRLFVRANLTAPIVDARTLSLWAAFASLIGVDEEIAAIHREGYLDFRGELAHLIAAVFDARGQAVSAKDVERAAIKINAVIDGLWLEGCMTEGVFKEDELVAIGLEAVEAVITASRTTI